ncbi:HAMP domain-containing methyl-accepting chemotaxis protein [Aureimonas psammosilenae]|uniref:HAMP domain-containing methyl-accepting chemotaxis protein n=1 Tax=Aureimonas psammosilenae TaxID=2495496 RepID=UPI00126135AA|nr:methyl-accepting chemotaxis protein [Aureimonas psammosilenae]
MRLTIKTKLIGSFGAVLALLGTAGYLGISSLGQSNADMEAFAARPFAQVQAVQTVDGEVMNVRRGILRALAANSDAARAPLKADYDASWTLIDESVSNLLRSMTPDEQRDIADLKPMIDNFRTMTDKAFAMASMADTELADKALNATEAPFAQLLKEINELDDIQSSPATNEILGDAVASLGSNAYAARLAMVSAVDLGEPAKIGAASDSLNGADQSFRATLETLRKTPGAPLDLIARLEGDWTALFKTLRGFTDIAVENATAEASNYIYTVLAPESGKVSTRLDALKDRANGTANGFLAQTQANYASARNMLIAIVVGAIAMGLAAALWMSLSISRGLNRSVKLAEDIGAGDLTQTVDAKTRDEIGDLQRAMNTMTLRLREIVGDVANSSSQVASGSQQSSATAEQLSQGSTEQAAATEQASSAMEEMAANIRQNSENATTTEKIAGQASLNADKSGRAVANSVEAMRTIADKIRIVQEIARQTDLLALNAAIEAARAGQHGKGFAVVASEVRKLAERSQTAAAEIGELSSSTLQISEEAGRMLEQLVPDIQRTAELVSEISAACREQNAGAEQINQAIQQLDQVTQQNASAANEMSATAEQLSAEAGRLNERAAYFRLDASPATVMSTPAAASKGVHALQARVDRFAASRPVAKKQPALKRPAAPAPAPAPAKDGFDFDLSAKDASNGGFERMSA